MKVSYQLGVLAIFITLLQACSPTLSPFTDRLYSENNWSESDLSKIQFYLSHDLILHRQISEGSSEIVSGEIKMVKGRKVEEIRIKSGTPGVYISNLKGKHFAIAFEDGSDNRYLSFGPNPKRRGTYVLLASDWEKGIGKVTYDNKTYYTDENGSVAMLMVDLKKITKTTVSSRSAKGRKVQ